MKKILSIILIIGMLLALCACDIDTSQNTTPSIPSQVGADNLEISTGSTTETVPFNPTPTDPVSTSEPTTEPTAEPTTEPPHVHSFSNATCTTPKTCSCGAIEGSATGHNWKEATCSEPKTCTVCGTTSGLTAGHNFSNGKCTACGKTDPNYNQETMVWIPTKGGKKYHTRAGCSNMDGPEHVTQSEAESRGFTPCKKCH